MPHGQLVVTGKVPLAFVRRAQHGIEALVRTNATENLWVVDPSGTRCIHKLLAVAMRTTGSDLEQQMRHMRRNRLCMETVNADGLLEGGIPTTLWQNVRPVVVVKETFIVVNLLVDDFNKLPLVCRAWMLGCCCHCRDQRHCIAF